MTEFQERFQSAKMSVDEMVEAQAFALSRATGFGVDVILGMMRASSYELGAYLVAAGREDTCPSCGEVHESEPSCNDDDEKMDTEIG